MLASTIQFSNTNPTNPAPTHQHVHRRRYEPRGTRTRNTTQAGVASGPNSMPTHHTPRNPPAARSTPTQPGGQYSHCGRSPEGDSSSSSTCSVSNHPTPQSDVTGSPPPPTQ